MADLIDPDDPNDPIARQFIPDVEELSASAAENADPIGFVFSVVPELS